MEPWLQSMARNKVKKRKTEKKIKRQIDVVWLVLIVMLLITFISVFTQENGLGVEAENLEKEAEIILNKLTDNSEFSFASNNAIQEEVLEEVSGMAYSELKNNLKVKNDFCVYFEDEGGNLVEIKDGIKSIGATVIKINGEPCGK